MQFVTNASFRKAVKAACGAAAVAMTVTSASAQQSLPKQPSQEQVKAFNDCLIDYPELATPKSPARLEYAPSIDYGYNVSVLAIPTETLRIAQKYFPNRKDVREVKFDLFRGEFDIQFPEQIVVFMYDRMLPDQRKTLTAALDCGEKAKFPGLFQPPPPQNAQAQPKP